MELIEISYSDVRYLLTERALLEKLQIVQLLKKFPAFRRAVVVAKLLGDDNNLLQATLNQSEYQL
jgi:hypothetical protein